VFVGWRTKLLKKKGIVIRRSLHAAICNREPRLNHARLRQAERRQSINALYDAITNTDQATPERSELRCLQRRLKITNQRPRHDVS